jgi:hypothetical protein
MVVRGALLAALTCASLSVAAGAENTSDGLPHSDVPEENALFRAIGSTVLDGTGQNGVPAGLTVSYELSNPGHCAPALQLWLTAPGATTRMTAGPPVSIRVHDLAGVCRAGPQQLTLFYSDGEKQPIATNSEAQQQALLAALQGLSQVCSKLPRPEAKYVLRAPAPAAAAAPAPPGPRLTIRSKREAQKIVIDKIVALAATGYHDKMSAYPPADSCVMRLIVHVPAQRIDTSGAMTDPRDDVYVVDWSKADKALQSSPWAGGGGKGFFLSNAMVDVGRWPLFLGFESPAADEFEQAAQYLQGSCTPRLSPH